MSETRLIDIIVVLEGSLTDLRRVASILKKSDLLKPELDDLQKAIELIDYLARRFRAFKGITG